MLDLHLKAEQLWFDSPLSEMTLVRSATLMFFIETYSWKPFKAVSE